MYLKIWIMIANCVNSVCTAKIIGALEDSEFCLNILLYRYKNSKKHDIELVWGSNSKFACLLYSLLITELCPLYYTIELSEP